MLIMLEIEEIDTVGREELLKVVGIIERLLEELAGSTLQVSGFVHRGSVQLRNVYERGSVQSGSPGLHVPEISTQLSRFAARWVTFCKLTIRPARIAIPAMGRTSRNFDSIRCIVCSVYPPSIA